MVAPIQSLMNMEFMLYGTSGCGYGSGVPSLYNNYCLSNMANYNPYSYNSSLLNSSIYNNYGYNTSFMGSSAYNPYYTDSYQVSSGSSNSNKTQSSENKYGPSKDTKIATAISAAVAAGAIKPQELEKIAKYSAGKAITDNEEKLTIGSLLGFPLVFEGGKWAARFIGLGQDKGPDGKRMKWGKNMKRHWENLRIETQPYEALKGNGFQSVKDAWNLSSKKESIKIIEDQVKKAESKPGFFRRLFNLGSPKSPIGEYVGDEAKRALIETEAGKMSGFKRFMKSNKMSFILFGAIEALTTVIPTFKELGAGKGLKQTAKSSVKVCVDVAAWGIGMKAGAAIGSLFGPVGSVAGAVLGQVAGLLFSHIGKKAVQKVIGEDELVIAEKEEAKKLAKAATTDSQKGEMLLANALTRIEQEGLTKDNQEIADTIQTLIPYIENAEKYSSNNPFA